MFKTKTAPQEIELKEMKLNDHKCIQKEKQMWEPVNKFSKVETSKTCDVISFELSDFLKDRRQHLLKSFPIGEIHK